MIPDLDATHTWNNGIVLNDNWNPDGSPKFPRFRLRDMPGFHSMPSRPNNVDVPVGRPYREIPRRTIPAGKPITYTGFIEAQDEGTLDLGEQILLNSFQDSGAGEMEIQQFGSNDIWTYVARVTALDIPGTLPGTNRDITRGYNRPFTLGLEMLDGRFYTSTEETWVSTLTSVTNGLVLPTTVPFQAGDITAGLPGSVAITPDLEVPVDPEITIPGPASGLVIQNTSQNRRMVFREDLAINAGQTLVVDFYDRTIEVDGVDFAEWLDDADTDYWDGGVSGLQKGPNEMQLSTATVTSMSIKFRRASLG